MTKGINKVALRQRRVNALDRLKEQEPRDAKHEKYINTQIKNVEHNIKINRNNRKTVSIK